MKLVPHCQIVLSCSLNWFIFHTQCFIMYLVYVSSFVFLYISVLILFLCNTNFFFAEFTSPFLIFDHICIRYLFFLSRVSYISIFLSWCMFPTNVIALIFSWYSLMNLHHIYVFFVIRISLFVLAFRLIQRAAQITLMKRRNLIMLPSIPPPVIFSSQW